MRERKEPHQALGRDENSGRRGGAFSPALASGPVIAGECICDLVELAWFLASTFILSYSKTKSCTLINSFKDDRP